MFVLMVVIIIMMVSLFFELVYGCKVCVLGEFEVVLGCGVVV